MYNNDIVFMFYSKSKNGPFPGYGTNEKMIDLDKDKYENLHKIPEWRKKLSNFWCNEFDLDGKKWLSVEHYYQGSKFKKENPDFYHQFSLSSNSDICRDPNMAKSAGGKTGKIKKIQYRNKNIKADADFFTTERQNEEMYLAQYAKFSQNSDLKYLLLETHDAKLMHIVGRSSIPIFFESLVIIRSIFLKE